MAVMIASKRASVAKLMEKLLGCSPVRSAAGASWCGPRSFNANAQRRDLDEERSMDVERRGDDAPVFRRRGGDFPGFFSDVLDPFSPSRSLSQVLNMMDQMLDAPLGAAVRGSAGPRRGWDAREDEDALYLRIDMPGLGKEDVRVTAEQGTLVIKGEAAEKESTENEAGRRYSSRIDLPQEFYKMDDIRAEMRNGVLKIVVPKVKQEERKDVFQVNIE